MIVKMKISLGWAIAGVTITKKKTQKTSKSEMNKNIKLG